MSPMYLGSVIVTQSLRLVMLPKTSCRLFRKLKKYRRNDGSAIKNVWLIQFQGYNYIKG